MFTFPMTLTGGYKNRYSTLFNGIDEYVQTSVDFSGLSAFTISGWFYRDLTTQRLDITQSDNSNNNRVKVILNSNGSAYCVVDGSSLISSSLGTGWIHIAATFDGSAAVADRIKLHVNGGLDGVLSGVPPTSVSIIGNSQTLRLGQDNGSSSFSDGNLDEVTTWNVALDRTEILELYNGRKPRDPKQHSQSGNLTNYWRMGDGDSATTIFDKVGADDGTLVNMDASNYVTNVSEGTFNSFSTIFNGINQTVDCGQAANFERTDSFSEEVYFKSTDAGTTVILSKSLSGGTQRGLIITLRLGVIRVGIYNDLGGNNYILAAAGSGFNSGDYYHLIVTYDGSSDISGVTVYIDGVSQAIGNLKNTLTGTILNAEPFAIASRAVTDLFFDGNIDEVVIYDKELSQVEVTERYNLGVVIDPLSSSVAGNILNYWRMGDGDNATTIFDNVGSDDGTLVNMDASNYTTDVPT